MYFPVMIDSDPQKRLSGIRLFLLDLDGTIYVENKLLPGAIDFLDRVRNTGRDYVFMTNNSSRSAADYLIKLNNLGIPATLESVFTSGQATALYLSAQKPGAKVFLVGTRSLQEEFAIHDLRLATRDETDVDYVVVGFDTELEYWKLSHACGLIDDGVPFLATHPDYVCPIAGKRYIPDCGAMCEMITHATGKKPGKVFGKPDPSIVQILCNRKKVPSNQTAMVGDRLYTDMKLAKNAGITSICVLTGETTPVSLEDSTISPDLVVESVAELKSYL